MYKHFFLNLVDEQLPKHPLVSVDIEGLNKVREGFSSLQKPNFYISAPIPLFDASFILTIVAHASENYAALL